MVKEVQSKIAEKSFLLLPLFFSMMILPNIVWAIALIPVGSYNSSSGAYSLDVVWSVFVSGDYAYTVSSWDNNLVVWNISAHGNPVPLGNYTSSSGAYSLSGSSSVYVSGDYAYTVSQIDDKLVVWNISAHGNPVPLGSYTSWDGNDSLDNAIYVFVSGDYAYTLSYNDNNLVVWNISAHGNPVPLGNYTSSDGAYSLDGSKSIFVSGDYAYTVSRNDDNFVVWNISAHGNPVPLGDYTSSSGAYSLDYAESVFVLEDYAYTLSYNDDNLVVWNISAHGNPVPLGNYTSSSGAYSLSGAYSVYVSGDYAYTVSQTDDNLVMWDISAHGNPVPMGSYTSSSGAYSLDYASSVFVSGDYAYTISTYDDNFAVFLIDTTAPNASLNLPAANYYNDTSFNVTFNCSATDNYNLANISLYITNSTNQSFSLNATTSTSGTSNSTTWALNLANGNYTWNCLAYDSAGNSDWDENKTVLINVTAPTVALNLPIANYYNDTFFNVTFNCSATDNCNLANISLYITNSTNNSFALNATTSLAGTSNSTAWAMSLANGNYTWNCLAYNSLGFSGWAENRTILINYSDADSDGLPNALDPLLYNESNVTKSGITNLNITIGGNSTNGAYSGAQEVKFYDSSTLLFNFTHNFSQSNLDLSKVTINQASTSLIVNLSGQLQGNKTLYIADGSFVSLCVKDAEISSISNMTSGCNGDNETDFTSCLGGTLTGNGIICTDLGSTIRIENLRYSAVRGTAAGSTGSPGGGGSCTSVWSCTKWGECVNGTQSRSCVDIRCYRTYDKPIEIQNCTCKENWTCGSWSNCSADGKQNRDCEDYNNCGTAALKPTVQESCVYEDANNSETQPSDLGQLSNLTAAENTKSNSLSYIYLMFIPLAILLFVIFIFNRKRKKEKEQIDYISGYV